jgi:hypothetical protein
LPKSSWLRKRSADGEIHLILPEYVFDEAMEPAEDLDAAEIRKIMIKEASKPLLLLRTE